MLKPLTLSLGLVLALSLSGVSKAGGLFHKDSGCDTCGLASPQGPVVSPQSVVPSAQECVQPCAKKCSLFEGFGHKLNCGLDNLSCGLKDAGCGIKDFCGKFKPKPKCYTYEWVLKKKRVWGHGGCGTPSCETCGVTPSAQGYVAPSGQGYTAPSGQAYTPASGQASYSTPAYGTGQIASTAPAGMIAPAPVGGDEAPPAPEVAPKAPTTPAAVPPAPGATSGLLFSTPAGN